MSSALHNSYEAWNSWRRFSCGCWANDLGFKITFCPRDNVKRGTHHK